MIYVFDEENIVDKGENAGCQQFFQCLKGFHKQSLDYVVKD